MFDVWLVLTLAVPIVVLVPKKHTKCIRRDEPRWARRRYSGRKFIVRLIYFSINWSTICSTNNIPVYVTYAVATIVLIKTKERKKKREHRVWLWGRVGQKGRRGEKKVQGYKCVWERERDRLKTSIFLYIWAFNEIGGKNQINLLSVSFHVPFRVLFRGSSRVPCFFPRFAFRFPRSTFHIRFISLFFFFYFANLT